MAQTGYGTSYPTATTQYWQAGDLIINSAPAKGQPWGWVCITAGYPGTWVPVSMMPVNVTSTTALISTITIGTRNLIANATYTGSYTLPQAESHAAGFELFVKNMSATSLTLAPSATNTYDAAAITLAQYGVITLLSAGSTVWYKKA